MEVAHILEDLAYDMGELPRDAIEAAILKRKQITPFLLEILKDSIHRIDDIIEDENYQGHLYAMYLLAQFREKEAFPLILDLFAFPGEIPHSIAGDVLTEDLSRILASVCDNRIQPFCEIIENSLLNEYVRASCQSALITLVGCGKMQRDEVMSYFKTLFQTRLERRPSFVWDNLVVCACSLYPEEVYTEICQAYKDNLINTSFISAKDVDLVLSKDKNFHLFQLYQNMEFIEDTVSEMEKWMGTFH